MAKRVIGEWRTHQELDRHGMMKPGEFRYCQNAGCLQYHFISSLKGSRPVADKWEGVKHK